MAENIEVILRIRPRNQREISEGDSQARTVTKFPSPQSIELENHVDPKGKPNIFNFDHVVDPESTQEQMYELIRPGLDSVFNARNFCLFTYGQTGAGKSFSMSGKWTLAEVLQGQMPDTAGIIPRLVIDMFDRIEKSPEIEYTVKFSYVEIYNEQIRDLLDVSKTNLKVRSQNNAVWVEGATTEYVKTPKEVFALIHKGTSNRAVSATLMNAESSRSHSIIIMTVGGRSEAGLFGSKLVLCDLAGSERVSKTAAAGDTLKEAQNINRSLSVLGNVINALSSAQNAKKGEKIFIPTRESKLTWLLSDCLGGASKTTLIIAASPVLFNLAETFSTCLFGQRCKSIKNKVVVNKHLSESEWQRLVDGKILMIHQIAAILSNTYNDYTALTQQLSELDVDQEQNLITKLKDEQKIKIAGSTYDTYPARHKSWERFLEGYQRLEYDIPTILKAVEANADLAPLLASIKTKVGGGGATAAAATTTPAQKRPTTNNTTTSSTPSEPKTPSIEILDTPSNNNDNNDNNNNNDDSNNNNDITKDDEALLNLDVDAPDFVDNMEKLLEAAHAEDDKAENKNNNNNSGDDNQILNNTNNTSTDMILRGRSHSNFSADQLPNLNELQTPVDRLVAILRQYFKIDSQNTSELLDLLLSCPDGSGLPFVITQAIKRQLGGEPLDIVGIAAQQQQQQQIKQTISPTAKKPSATVVNVEDGDAATAAGVPTTDATATEGTKGKKVVKKVIKKVVKKPATEKKDATTTTTAEEAAVDVVVEPTIVPEATEPIAAVVVEPIEEAEEPTTTTTTTEKIDEQPQINEDEIKQTKEEQEQDQPPQAQEEQPTTEPTIIPDADVVVTVPPAITPEPQIIIKTVTDPVLVAELEKMREHLAALQLKLQHEEDEKVNLKTAQDKLAQDLLEKDIAIQQLSTVKNEYEGKIDELKEENDNTKAQLEMVLQQVNEQQQQAQAEAAQQQQEEQEKPIVVVPQPIQLSIPPNMVKKERYEQLKEEYIKLKKTDDRSQLIVKSLKRTMQDKADEIIQKEIQLKSLWAHLHDVEASRNTAALQYQDAAEQLEKQRKENVMLIDIIKKLKKAADVYKEQWQKNEKLLQTLQSSGRVPGRGVSSTSSYNDLKQFF